MYLSRFQINPQRREARKLLSSPQAMHAAVLAGFPAPAANGDGRVLWRVDRDYSHRILLYVASPTAPDFTHLVEHAGWPKTTQTWETRSYDDLLSSLKKGQRWAFRLTANPVRSGRPKEQSHGPTRRYGHVTVDQQRQWLLSRTERAGFQVLTAGTEEPDLIVRERETVTFPRRGSKVTLRRVCYDGRLEVTDAAALRHTLIRGLGHGKAYGCGLLTLAPVG